MLVSASLLLVANMSIEPIVTLYVGEIARPGDDVVLYAGAAMSAGAFAAMLAAPTIGRLADRHGHWRVVGALASPPRARCSCRRPSSPRPGSSWRCAF